MEKLARYRQIVRNLISEYAEIPVIHGEGKRTAVLDEAHDRYMLVIDGWLHEERMYGTIVDIEIKDEKVWLHCVNTDRDIAQELVFEGIPHEDIVIAFRHASVRNYTGYAVG